MAQIEGKENLDVEISNMLVDALGQSAEAFGLVGC